MSKNKGSDDRLCRARDDLRAALREMPSTLHLSPEDPLYRLVVAAQKMTVAIDLEVLGVDG